MKLAAAVMLSLFALGASAGDRPERLVDFHGLTGTFLLAHPDLKYRLEGQQAWDDGDPVAAAGAFRKAAEWGDKPSQGMLADLLWNGTGTPRNRVEAYIWADLAAERGYTPLLAQRERFWADLSADERDQVLAVGPGFYDRYGDDVVQPRLAARIRSSAPRLVAGSHLGYVTPLKVIRPDYCADVRISVQGQPGCEVVDGDDFYDRRVWNPDLYFAWQDRVADEAARGTVDVGALRDSD